MTEKIEVNQERAKQVRGVAYLVAEHLTTRTANKKHGGYNIYEDKFISVHLDTYVPNIDVRLIDGTLVFAQSYHSSLPDVFHDGNWADHLFTLEEPAKKAMKEKEEQRERERVEEHNKHFTPINLPSGKVPVKEMSQSEAMVDILKGIIKGKEFVFNPKELSLMVEGQPMTEFVISDRKFTAKKMDGSEYTYYWSRGDMAISVLDQIMSACAYRNNS